MTSTEGPGDSRCSADPEYVRLLSALLLLRGLNYTEHFHLTTGVAAAGEFGDLVFVYRENEQVTACFVRQRLRSDDVGAVGTVFNHLLKCFTSSNAIQEWLPQLEQQIGVNVDNVELIHYTDAVFNSERSSANPDHLLNTGGLSLTLEKNSQSYVFFEDLKLFHEFLQDLPSDINDAELLSTKIEPLKVAITSIEILKMLDNFESDPTHEETVNNIRENDLVNGNKFGLFLKKFKLFHSEANRKGLRNVVRDEFVKLCGGRVPDFETILKRFLNDMETWTNSINTNINGGFLTKESLLCRNMGYSLVSALSEVKSKSIGEVSVEFGATSVDALKDYIDRYPMVSVIADDDTLELSVLKTHEALKDVSHLVVSLDALLGRRAEVLKAWASTWCTVLVVHSGAADVTETRSVMAEASRVLHAPDKKFVFLTKQKDAVARKCCKGVYGGCYEHTDVTVLSHLGEETMSSIRRKRVVFQGSTGTLRSLIESDPNIVHRIRGKVLMSLLTSNEDIIIGRSVPSLLTPYLPRNITRSVIIKKELLESKQTNAIYVFVEATNDDLVDVLPYGERACTCDPPTGEDEILSESAFILLNNRSDEELFRVCINEEDNDVHCFCLSDGALEWRWSKGDVRTVEAFAVTEKTQSYRENIASGITDKVVLIVGEHRVGKSTLLQHLATEVKSSRPGSWVVCVNLGDHISYINSTVFDREEKVLEFLEYIVCVGEQEDFTLEKMTFRRSLAKLGNVEIFIDGYDHLPHFLVGKIVSVLKLLLDMQIRRLWTTCSPIFKDLLQQTVNVLPFHLEHFNEGDQKRFLMNAWSDLLPERDRLERFVDAGIGLLNTSLGPEEKEMSGIPLQTVLFAESFESELKSYATTDVIALSNRLNLIQLYDKFVEKMSVDLLRRKLDGDVLSQPLLIENKITLTDKYKIVALMTALCEDDLRHMDVHSIQYKYNSFLADFRSYELKGSLITVSENKPQFLYPNLTEYFVALWLAEVHMTIGEFLEKKIFNPRLKKIRIWLDYVLAKNCELHTAVLNKDRVRSEYLLETGALVNKVDKGGRSALHLAAMYDLRDIVKVLLTKGANMNLQDKIMNWRPLRYADTLESWGAIEMLLATRAKTSDLVHTASIIRVESHVNEILSLACTEGYINLIAFVLSHSIEVNKFIGPEESTPLHFAAKHGQTDTVKYLVRHETEMAKYGRQYSSILRYISSSCRVIECRAELDVKTVDGYTPLMLAAKKGNLSTAMCLVNLGASVSAHTVAGLTPLHLAAGSGSDAVAEYLLGARADVNWAGRDGVSPLHLAALGGHASTVRLLVHSGARVNCIDGSRASPIHCAAKGGHEEAVRFLIEFGAVVNIKNNERHSPLHLAAGMGHVDTVRCLLNVGAVANTVSNDNATAVHLAAREKNTAVLLCMREAGVAVNVRNSEGSTPLHWACREGHRPTVLCLVQCGADMNVQNHDGYTPLHLAAWRGRTAAVRYLLEAGADVVASMECNPPVAHLAARGGHTATLECLLEAGADANARDSAGSTSLHWASWAGHAATVRCLLEAGADYHLLDNNGSSALHWAAGEGHAEVVAALVAAGAPANVSNQDGEVPAHWAAKEGHLAAIQALLGVGADVNILNTDQLSPLHIAMQENNVPVMECLLNAGADINC